MLNEFIYPIFAVLGGVTLSLIVGKFRKGDIGRIVGIGSILTSIILLAVFYPFKNVETFQSLVILDGFGAFFSFLFLGLGLFILVGSMKLLDNQPELPALVLLAILGMVGVSVANDLIMLFASWEIMSLATYALAGLGRKKESTEAAMKYFIYGAVSSALVLFAISLVYGVLGTTKIDELTTLFSSISGGELVVIILASIIFVFGFGYKMGMVPFHLWLPDVYEGSSAPISALLAGVAKKVALVAAARIFIQAIFFADFRWDILFGVLAVITMTVGNVAALAQKKVARMFAYSSISQVGYILIGFAVFTSEGIAAGVMQMSIHAITTIGAFITIGIIAFKKNLRTYDDYKGLGRTNPIIGVSITLMVLSLAGIPPLGGFVSKLFLFKSAVDSGYLWLAILGVLNSVLSLGYYLPLVRNMFLEKREETTEDLQSFDFRCIGPRAVTIVVALALLVITIFAQTLYQLIIDSAGTLI